MAYHDETTGAIAKAIVKLSQIADFADNIADHEMLSILAINAAAELDKLHAELNHLRQEVSGRVGVREEKKA